MEGEVGNFSSCVSRLQSLVDNAMDSLQILREQIHNDTTPQQQHLKMEQQIDTIFQWFNMIKTEVISVVLISDKFSEKYKSSPSKILQDPVDIKTEGLQVIHNLGEVNICDSAAGKEWSLEDEEGILNESIDCRNNEGGVKDEDETLPKKRKYKETVDGKFECEDCKKVLSTRVLLVVHKCKVKKKINKLTFKCTLCSRAFKTANGRDVHVVTCHTNYGGIQCNECEETFIDQTELTEHTENVHSVQCGDNVHTEGAVLHSEDHRVPIESIGKEQSEEVENQDNISQEITTEKHHIRSSHCSKSFVTNKALRMQTMVVHKQGMREKSNKQYACDICGKCFTTRNFLFYHAAIHRVKDGFKCPEKGCGKLFSNKGLVGIHIKHFHTSEEPPRKKSKTNQPGKRWCCRWCSRKFSTYKGRLEHEQQHIAKGEPMRRKFKCSICAEAFLSEMTLKHHMFSHGSSKVDRCKEISNTSWTNKEFDEHEAKSNHKEKKFKCQVAGCDKAYCSEKLLHRHYQNVHPAEQGLTCDMCTATFTTDEERLLHESTYGHSHITKDVSGKYECSVCDEKFSSYFALQRHEKNHAKDGQLLYNCDICNKKFKLAESLEKHARLHTGDRPYQCDFCGNRFFNEAALYRHRRFHTGEMFPCELCNKKFPMKNELKAHMKSHTGERPYVCDVCGAAYFQACHLKNHKVKHTGAVLKCTLCEKTFTRNTSLRNHMKRHTGEGLHCCEYCNKTFIKRDHLNRHIKSCPANTILKCEQTLVVDVNNGGDQNNQNHAVNRSGVVLKCAVCEKTFSENTSLRNHMKRHTGVGLISCEYCKKNFIKRNHLNRHVQSCHPNAQLKCEESREKPASQTEMLVVNVNKGDDQNNKVNIPLMRNTSQTEEELAMVGDSYIMDMGSIDQIAPIFVIGYNDS